MRILIITSCTGEKAVTADNALDVNDFRAGQEHVRQREKDLSDLLLPAGEMYTGEQHVRLMRGVKALRTVSERNGNHIAVDVHILSAGYGLISEFRKIAPYGCTFATMKAKELRRWADQIHVPEDFRRLAEGPYDLGLVLLGDNYLQACELKFDLKFGGSTVLFCGNGQAQRMPRIPNLRVLRLSNAEAKLFSCGLVGLKGELTARLLKKLGEDRDLPQKLKDPATDVLAVLEERTVPGSLAINNRVLPKANHKVDTVIHIPRSWWDKPHRQKLRYFIPEWDDLVDPDYDFINDSHSGGSGDWSNEVYAHQLYPEPNYDGILVSRAVAEKSKKKKERINALGVHRFMRVPREFPIMGDCGAFDYIMREKPPYSTEDVIDYYTRLDFDFGVSVDHLIVSATEHQKRFRYELTIHNAEDFLKQHRKAGLRWEPIGAVQGWDAASYAKAAAAYVKMGYRYLGLGGLVRTSTREILGILAKVREAVPHGIGIHLFGLARLRAISAMAGFGVTSVDSASALRKAWLGNKDNYWSQDGRHYRAIRVPEAGKSFRAKRMVTEGRATSDFVSSTERRVMSALREFDRGGISVDEALNVIGEYDHLITSDRSALLEQYRGTLESAPWRKCSCAICQRDGIEVVIFRGNNRNRRRGFHNTYVFYQLLQRALSGEAISFDTVEDKNGQLELPDLVTV
jgi:hypothetical protein